MRYQKPLFKPKSDWTLPSEFPNLSDAKKIAVDIETCDPDLKEKGPGVRRNGYMIGLAIGVPEKQWYFPFAHSHGNQFAKNMVLKWAKDQLCKPSQPKVGANLIYDLDYLYHEGVKVSGPFYDVQVAEPLIDENKRGKYNLNALSKEYLDDTKEGTLIEDTVRTMGLKGDPRAHLYLLDPAVVGPYAEKDTLLPLQILEKQEKKLAQEGLTDLFEMETKLIPMLLGMRQRGVKIDTSRLDEVHGESKLKLKTSLNKLSKMAGMPIDIWAARSIAKVFDNKNLKYPLTPKTQEPSFTKNFLEKHPHPIAQEIVECRKLDKFIGTFLEGSIMDMLVGDRIHCQFNQLKSDDFGTVTGRFSSSNPNLQFIPERDSYLGPLIRSMFIPEEMEYWGRADYSQIEIRILVHYARGMGARAIVREYIKNPKTDYHEWCSNFVSEYVKISRKQAKTINFGLIYGMGKDKTATQLGILLDAALELIEIYNDKLPFLKETTREAMKVAENRGFVKTLLGRRRRFEKDPTTNKRNGAYKAFNAVDQGTAADIMKKAMVDIWEAGICDVLGAPLLTVHDELDWSVPTTKQGNEAFLESVRIMEDTIKLKIPVVVDPELKKNWGQDLE